LLSKNRQRRTQFDERGEQQKTKTVTKQGSLLGLLVKIQGGDGVEKATGNVGKHPNHFWAFVRKEILPRKSKTMLGIKREWGRPVFTIS